MQEDSLQNDGALFKEVGGFLYVPLQYLVAERGEINDIDIVIFNNEPVVAHEAQIIAGEQDIQGVGVQFGAVGAACLRKSIHGPVDEFGQCG
jgi:hypothetical protein